MTSSRLSSPHVDRTLSGVAQPFRPAVAATLRPDEIIVSAAELDLNSQLFFEKRCLVLTTARLLEFALDTAEVQKIVSLSDTVRGQASLQGGLGYLEITCENVLLARFAYTAAVEKSIEQLASRLNAGAHMRRAVAAEEDPGLSVCPSCGALLTAEQPICLACTPSAAPPPTRSLLRLMGFAQRRWQLVSLGFVLTLLATAVSLIPPYLTRPLMDDVLLKWQTNDEAVAFSRVYPYLTALFGAAFVAWLLSWAKTYVLAVASEQISSDLRNATYAHLQRLSLEFFGGRRTGDLISRIGSDSDRICNFLSSHLVDFASDVLMVLMTSAILISMDPVLAMAMLLPFPAVGWLIQRVRIRLRHGFAKASHAWGEMLSVLTDAIPGVRVVKAFAQEQREIDRFQRSNQHVLDSNVRVNRLWAFFSPTVSFLSDMGILIIWIFGAWRVSQGIVTVGMLAAFLAYISRFYSRLDSMSRMLANTQRAAASSYRIFEILERKPTVVEPTKPVNPGRLRGGIELQDVHFKYGTRPVIRGISLSIQPGEMIGLVGPSGSGKSTLVNLVCRFYDVTEGAIIADGNDIRSFPIEEYRRNIGIVLQEPFLFYGTIAENIAYGRPNADRDEIIAAARAAHAHEFIRKLPEGYDSLVGERGQSLSGGERQRLSIARALLTDPRILILDEATSAVDNETEREIQAALDNLVRGRTTIAIAHRLSTLRNADRIIVMDGGEISEIGPHAELLERGGLYARLHQVQLELAERGR